MQYSSTSSSTSSLHPAPRLQHLLNLLDHIAERSGRSVPQIVDIDTLSQLPEGTFGRAWVNHLDANNLQPFITGSRRKQLHDGIHVLTGYGTDPIGEVEVQAFVLGAKFHPIHVLLTSGLLRMIQRQPSLRQRFHHRLIWQAYQRGRNSKFDPDNWQPEHLWYLPVTEVRKIFAVN